VISFFRDIWILSRNIYYVLAFSVITIYHVCRGQYNRAVTTKGARDFYAANTLNSVLTYDVINPENAVYKEGRSHILMSNHRSHYDIPLIMHALPGDIRFIAKRELLRVPIWGRASWVGECIFVDRKNHEQALKDMAVAKRKMEDGLILWIAPEGTRSRSGKLNPFKKGGFMMALQTNAIIIPIGVRGTEKVLPADTWRTKLGEHVKVHIGKPIDTATYSIEDRDALMERVKEEISVLGNYEAE
jgi:1-acyl-sn-glycerol-3-phosphate acyltransferase